MNPNVPRSTWSRAKTPEEYQLQLAKLEEELALAKEQVAAHAGRQKTPFGARMYHLDEGHVLTNGLVVLRRPLYDALLTSADWAIGMYAAVRGAKRLGFSLFELDFVYDPAAHRRHARRHGLYLPTGPDAGEEWKQGAGDDANDAQPDLTTPNRVRVWALVVADNPEAPG